MQVKVNNREYISGLLGKGTRETTRGFSDYRKIGLTLGALPQAEGSAMADMGDTKVLAGVKLGVGTPLQDKPGEGTLITSTELLPMASPRYETGPPSPDAIEFARVVDRGIRAANIIDTKALFIEEDKVWNVFVDIYVLNYDGNLFDAGTLAAMSAILTAKQPRFEDGAAIRDNGLSRIKTNGKIVTSCTFGKLDGHVLLDPDGNEEDMMSSRVTIANDEGAIRAMQKGLRGAFSVEEVEKAIDVTFERSKELRSIVKKVIGE
ncbi:Exosome complex component Rrp42 [uncultured archaeon]|nr:Exosome complex component Rrp42 [uncultured archaeon]